MNQPRALACLRALTLGLVTVVLLQLGAWLQGVTAHSLRRTNLLAHHVRRAAEPHSGYSQYAPNRSQLLSHACNHAVVPLDARCPRQLVVRYLRSAGFGHQFTELLFGMYAAHYLGLTFTYSPIEASGDHGDNYTSLVYKLGLERFFVEGLGLARAEDLRALHARNASIFRQWLDASYSNKLQAHVSCSSVVTIEGWWHCTGVADNNCFWAPEHEFLFQRYRDCLRAGVRVFGNKKVLDECVLLEEESGGGEGQKKKTLPRDTVVVVWHLRLGDVAPHKPGDEFFKRVVAALDEITQGGPFKRVRILLVGGGKGLQKVPREYVERLQGIVGTADGKATRETAFDIQSFADGSFEKQFVAMMQADVLIGSGSSVPQVAALLSARPLFFNHVPKHGYGYGQEALADAVDMDSSGHVLESLRRVRLMLFEKIGQNGDEGGSCRTEERRRRL